MKLPGVARVEGFLYPLVATSLLLGVLLIWQRTYEQSCLALASPGLVYIAISYGLLEYRMERKRFALDYYLDRRSSWRRWFRGSWLPVLISMVVALPLTIFLLAFVALSRSTDWLFLASAAVLAPVLFVRLSIWARASLQARPWRGRATCRGRGRPDCAPCRLAPSGSRRPHLCLLQLHEDSRPAVHQPRLSPAYGGGLHSACPFGVPGCG